MSFAQDECKAIAYFKDVGEAEVNEKRDFYGRLAIHVAAGGGNNIPEVKRLLSLGADIHSKDKFNNTPLHEAAKYSHGDSHFDVIKFLLELGAEVNSQSKNGMTPLHYLSEESNVKTIRLLLFIYGAKVNIKNNQGETPLSKAISYGYNNFEVYKLLLDCGSDINNSNNNNETPLHHAFQWSNFKLVKFLVKNGANVDLLGSKGRITLMVVLESYHFSTDCVRFLIEYFDVNTVDSFGKNILSYLNGEDKRNVWETILEHFAKLRALDFQIDTELHKTISNRLEYREYFKRCTEELLLAKSTKLKNCWITYFNLLMDSKRKLKNYAGNEDLVEYFKRIKYLNKFPIYGAEMLEKVDKGIKVKKSFDQSSIILSIQVPIFNPNHLIIKDVLDCLKFKDYSRLISAEL